MILDSGVEYTSTLYGLLWNLSEPAETKQIYTITIWGKPSEGSEFAVYFGDDGRTTMGFLEEISEGIYRLSGSVSKFNQDDELRRKYLQIYTIPRNEIDSYTIHRIKMEKGKNLNPIWTPAPQDFNKIYTRLATLEAKITT